MRSKQSTWRIALAAAVLSAACATTPDEGDPPLGDPSATSRASACGGFGTPGALTDRETYCAAERLEWTYDAAQSRLVVSNTRAGLNCCGDRTQAFAVESGTYVFTERDAPQGGTGRCRCTCVFDFEWTVANVPASPLPARVVREVTDSGAAAATLWSGTLDLAAGSGSIVLDATAAGAMCETTGP